MITVYRSSQSRSETSANCFNMARNAIDSDTRFLRDAVLVDPSISTCGIVWIDNLGKWLRANQRPLLPRGYGRVPREQRQCGITVRQEQDL